MGKLSKNILNSMISGGHGTDYNCFFQNSVLYGEGISIVDLSQKLGRDVEDIRAAVRFLESSGYLEYTRLNSKSGSSNIGIHLSHKGLNWKHYRAEKLLSYVADKWIDFLALAVSIIAFIQSCIALSN